MIKKIAVLFVFAVSLKVIVNFRRLYKVYKLQQIYLNWVESLLEGKNPVGTHQSIKPEAIDLFIKSGITRPSVSRVVSLGMNHVQRSNPDVWDNMFVNSVDIISLVEQSFINAHSVFKFRVKQAINPFYWMESILLLPESIIKYLGFNSDNFFVKFANLMWWIIGVFYTVYSDKINPIIQDYLSKLFK